MASAVVTNDVNYGEGAGHGFLPGVGGIDISDATVGTATRGLDQVTDNGVSLALADVSTT